MGYCQELSVDQVIDQINAIVFTALWFAVATGGNSSWLTVHQDKSQLCVKTFHLSSTLQCTFPCISGALHKVSFYRPIVSFILIYSDFYYLLCFASFLSRGLCV